MKAAGYHLDSGVSEKPREPKPCNFFPPVVREALIAASQTPVTHANPLARVIAIDNARARARSLYPELFHQEI